MSCKRLEEERKFILVLNTYIHAPFTLKHITPPKVTDVFYHDNIMYYVKTNLHDMIVPNIESYIQCDLSISELHSKYKGNICINEACMCMQLQCGEH